jgi:hypothetical protein
MGDGWHDRLREVVDAEDAILAAWGQHGGAREALPEPFRDAFDEFLTAAHGIRCGTTVLVAGALAIQRDLLAPGKLRLSLDVRRWASDDLALNGHYLASQTVFLTAALERFMARVAHLLAASPTRAMRNEHAEYSRDPRARRRTLAEWLEATLQPTARGHNWTHRLARLVSTRARPVEPLEPATDSALLTLLGWRNDYVHARATTAELVPFVDDRLVRLWSLSAHTLALWFATAAATTVGDGEPPPL